MDTLDSFTHGYIICALWSSTDNSDPETGGDPIDDNYSLDDIAVETLATMASDCAEFQAKHAALLQQAYDHATVAYDDDHAGHDFWLTRHGHGAGFWDRDLGEIGDKLAEAARVYGSVDLFIGDDGQVHAL